MKAGEVDSDTPRHGGTLTMVLSADPPSLDPVQLRGVQNWAEAIAVPAIFDELFYLDASNCVQPKLGSSIQSSDCGKSWEVKLRPDLCFSDGSAFDSEAIRFNWARLADPANRSPVLVHAALIDQMEVIDRLTLRVTLKTPHPHWDMVVARYMATVGSPAGIASMAEGSSKAPAGAGPFLLAEWEPGSQMRFVRNPDYWQKDKPYLDEIVVLTGMADAAPKYETVTSGRAQLALEPLGGNLLKYLEQPDRYDLLTTPETGGGVALAMNLAIPPFDDLRVRSALSLALDSAEFVKLAGYGRADMVMTTVDRQGTPFADPDICLPVRNITAAQKLVDEVVADRGQPIQFTLETFANEGHIREADAIRQILESHLRNVSVEVAVGSVAELVGKWSSGEYQATNYAVQWSAPELDLPANFASASSNNIMGYRNDEVDALLDRLAGATDQHAIIDAHRKVLKQVLRDLPVIWLSHKEAFHVVDSRAVRDWKLFYSLRPLVEDAWLTEPQPLQPLAMRPARARNSSESGNPALAQGTLTSRVERTSPKS